MSLVVEARTGIGTCPALNIVSGTSPLKYPESGKTGEKIKKRKNRAYGMYVDTDQ